MVKRWDVVAALLAAGLTLVGCSMLSGPPGEQAGNPLLELPPSPWGLLAPMALKPGLTPVTVDGIREDRARIRWRSAWDGKTVVWYGTSPKLMPHDADRTPATFGAHTELGGLAPATRYFFQVEVQTTVGVARSAVLSFRTW